MPRALAHPSLFALIGLLAGWSPAALRSQEEPKPAIAWRDAGTLTVEGRGWTDPAAPWARLPAEAEATVRPAVWDLSRHSAGIAVRFATDARDVHVRWSVGNATLAMPHMPATGVSGVDLYGRDSAGDWRWIAVGRPTAVANQARLLHAAAAQPLREYLLYLPLYNSTTSLEIGVPEGARLDAGAPRAADRAQPIVFYGTSITHGACASRPGTCHVARLGRMLDRPVVNLGFSGNGRMELEVGAFLPALRPAVLVIDCLPNLDGQRVAARTQPLVRQLRAALPEVPIVLVEDRAYPSGWIHDGLAQRNADNGRALREAFDALVADGVENLHYLARDNLLGADGDDTVDGSHPTDLGFYRHAEAFAPLLRKLLQH